MDLFPHVFHIFFSYIITEILILNVCIEIVNFDTDESKNIWNNK